MAGLHSQQYVAAAHIAPQRTLAERTSGTVMCLTTHGPSQRTLRPHEPPTIAVAAYIASQEPTEGYPRDVATQCRCLHLQSCIHSSTSFEGHWIEPSFLQVSVLPEPPPLTDPPGYTARERSVTPSCMPHYVDGNVTRDHPYTVAYGEAVKLPLYPMGGPTSR